LPDPGWCDPLASRSGLVMRSRSIELLPIGFGRLAGVVPVQ
jgi:hypothetical protein